MKLQAMRCNLRRNTLIVALLVVPVLLLSCYGRFPLTRAVYRFNGDITDNKFIHSLVFWVFVILPVYDIALLGDALIFNLIEFWTGETLDVSYRETRDDGTAVALESTPDGREAVLTVSRNGQPIDEVRFVKNGDGAFDVLDRQGNRTGIVDPREDGMLDIRNADGELLKTVAPQEILAATAGY